MLSTGCVSNLQHWRCGESRRISAQLFTDSFAFERICTRLASTDSGAKVSRLGGDPVWKNGSSTGGRESGRRVHRTRYWVRVRGEIEDVDICAIA